jgi:hypothetical protein
MRCLRPSCEGYFDDVDGYRQWCNAHMLLSDKEQWFDAAFERVSILIPGGYVAWHDVILPSVSFAQYGLINARWDSPDFSSLWLPRYILLDALQEDF